MRLAKQKRLLPALLALALWIPGQAWGAPPRAACTHASAHVSTFTPNCADFLCDLVIDPAASPGVAAFDGVRIGDPGSSGEEAPRFFFDEVENRFHTELFSLFYNNGGEAVPSAAATVRFAVKPCAAAPAVCDTSGDFLPIGNYVMDVPGRDTVDRLYPTYLHMQPLTKPVCWILGAGEAFPKRFMLRAQVDWVPDESTGNNTLYQLYDLTTEALPADIAFAMDLSGSMGIPVPGGSSRLAVAQDRARMFIDLIEIEDEMSHNRLGLFGFATGMPDPPRTVPAPTGTWKSSAASSHSALLRETAVLFPFREIAADSDRTEARIAISDPTVVRPYGCTPVGQGLLRAKAALDPSVLPGTDRSRAIILFSDGLQNVGPYVNAVPPGTCGGPSSFALIDAVETFKNNTPTLPIYSVFFGAESGWAHQLMRDLQAQTGGDYLYYTGTSLELAAAYYQIRHLVASNALLFLEENGEAVGTSPTAAVPVHFDAASQTATVGLAWPVGALGTLLTVEARPVTEDYPQPWQDLGKQLIPATHDDESGNDRFQDAYRVFRFTPGASTTWELRVRQVAPGQGTVPYTLAVFARTEEVRLKASLGDEGFAAGKALPVYADLRSAGHPVPDADVRATVTAPARPFSTTLRKYADRLTVDRGAGDQTVPRLAAQLQGVLEREVGSPELYPVRQLTLTLNDRGQGADRLSGDGVYTGEVPPSETSVAGNYGVIVTATGSRSGVPFERTEKLGSIAAIGPIDPQRTEVRFSAPRQVGDRLRAVDVTVLATDRFGNATFPGAASAITLEARPGGGTLTGTLADDLTSTYSQTLLLAPGEQPAVALRIDGQDLGSFQPGPAAAFRRFEASLHAGLAMPHGVFGQGLDNGPAFAIDATYRFTLYVALRSELGLSLFDDPAGGDRRMFHFIPYLQLRNPVPVWQPYFEAGPGLYDLESAGTASGFSAGIGVQRRIAPRLRLDLALHGHHAGGELDATYSQIKVGLQIVF